MPKIVLKGDNLNRLNADFTQQRLEEPAFLNSVPKCGTHLLRNIVRMFVPVNQQYHAAFIQHAVLRQHQAAFSPVMPQLSWGHLFCRTFSRTMPSPGWAPRPCCGASRTFCTT